MKELFSVIMPVYNREKIVVKALESVKAQQYRPIELIIVNDGSTDKTLEKIEAWTNKNLDEGFTVKLISQTNAGPSAARNKGIENSNGKYIQFLDSDDLIPPERFNVLVEQMTSKSADFIQTGFEGVDLNTGKLLETRYGRLKNSVHEQMLMGVLWPNTLRSVFTRELIEKSGPWNVEMKCFEDREFVERAIIKAENPICIREVMATAGRNTGGNVTDLLKTKQGRLNRILCEESLASNIDHLNVSDHYKSLFKGRLYTLALRTFAQGWDDLGFRLINLADSIKANLDIKQKIKAKLVSSSAITRQLLILFYKLYAKIR